jgi:hypothetical protein
VLAHSAGMERERHPDEPRDASVDEELNEPTRESMETLGRADLDEDFDEEATQQTDETSPGQNSDWLPQ